MKTDNLTIGECMTPTPRTIGFDIPLEKGRAMMREHSIRHLPVLNAGKLVGVLSERNVQFGLASLHGEKFIVEDVMMPDVFTVSPETPVSEVVEAMAQEKYGSAIIQDASGKVVGVFTTVDACRLLAQMLKK